MPNIGHNGACRAWALATACMVLTAAPGPAQAGPPKPIENPTPKDMARAKELYDNGKGLYQEGSYEGAAFAFEEAYKLSGDINVLYNVSLAYDRAGDFEKALRFLEYYRALAPEGERAALTQKVESLKIRLEKQKEAEAEGEGEGDADAEPDEPDPPATPPPATTGGEDTGPTDDGLPKVFTPVVGVLAGVGALGFGLGIGFGASSLGRTRAAEDGCSDGLCDVQTQGDLDKARNRALVADISIGVGAAATVAMAALLIVNAVKRKKAKAAAGATSRLQPTWGGLQVRF